MEVTKHGLTRTERWSSLEAALLEALDGFQAKVWTTLPAIVISYDATKQTIVAQPTIQARVRSPDLTWTWKSLPPCPDVPVQFPTGGGYSLTFPIQPGDECTLHFASRCIDAWWYYGDVQVQSEMRMHDLSDAFASFGPRSLPRVIPNLSTNTVQLRSDDGGAMVEIAAGHVVNIVATTVNVTASSVVAIQAPNITMTGADVKIEGTASLELKCNHGFVWTPSAINAYQNGIPSTPHAPPAP